MSQQIDASLTVGVNMEYQNAVSQFQIFKQQVEGEKFEISAGIPKDILNTEATKRALQGIKNELVEIYEVKGKESFFEVDGKKYKEVVGLMAKGKNAAGQLTTVNLDVASSFKEVDKATKAYASMATKATNAINSSTNMENKHKTAIQGTANQILKTIDEWNGLSVAQQANSDRGRELQEKLRRLNIELDKNTGAAKTSANAMQGFGTRMANALKQSFAYGLAMRAIRLAQQELNNAIRYTIDLNTEMTKIRVLQVEGAKTAYEINNLANSFNRLAQEMGASTLQVAQGSVEWLRQGKTIEETGKLLKSTLMLSKLGNLGAAQSTEYLTSTLNGYKMEASEATSVVDKLIAVDNVAATSVRELATALQYSAAIASETGVSFEQLVSYIGVVSETTRQNAESIGQGMKTMLTRMRDIKGGKLDEDGLGINNVEIALKRANIELRDSRDSFRDFGGVLEELAGKWGTLSETEQAFIAKSIAGIRQVNMFTVLMQNMGRAIELQEVQFSSAGLAADRYKIYLDSLEAKIAQLKATWEGLIQDTITSGFVGSLLDAGKTILDFIEKIGGLKNSVTAIISVFALLKLPALIGVIKSVIVAIQTLTASTVAITPAALMSAGAMETLGVSSAAAGATASAAMAAATLGISLLIAALVAAGIALERLIVTQKEYAKLATETYNEVQNTQEKIDSVKELQKEYEQLSIKVNDTSLSTEELESTQSRWYEVQKQLNTLIPLVTGAIDEQGRFIIKNTDAITAQVEELEKLKTSQQELMQFQAMNYLFDYDYEAISSEFLEFLIDLNHGAKSIINEMSEWQTEKINEMLESWGLLGNLEAPKFTFEEKTSKTVTGDFLATALGEMNDASTGTDVDKYLEKRANFDELYATTRDMMGRAGADGALLYAEEFALKYKDKYPELVENIYAIAAQVATNEEKRLAEENAETYRTEYIKALQRRAGTNSSGVTEVFNPDTQQMESVVGLNLNEAQATKAFDIGIAGSQEITDYLITERIPSLIKSATELSTVFDTLGKKQLITPEQVDRLGNFGIEVRYTEDGLQELYQVTDQYGKETNTLIPSQEALLDIIKLSESQFTSYSAEQQKIIDMYIEQALATEKASEGYKNLESAVNALSSAYKEQSENGEISISTAMNLVEAGMAEAVMWDSATGSLRLNEEAMINLQKAKIEMAIADQRLITTTAGFTQAQVAAAQAMIAAYQEIYNALGQGSPIANLSPISGGASGAKQEDPRIKENEELIEQKEEQIDLYEDEKDALKDMQDEYDKWIDKQKESLQLAKEESDYFKGQKERTTDLAKLKKEIALLELDNTEEARAKRLQLEEEAANLEKEIAENTEERRYDLQMQALDNLKNAYDEMIAKQIEAIDLLIEGIRDQIEDIRDIIADLREEGRSGGNGGTPSHTPWTGPKVQNPQGTNIITVQDEQGNTWTLPVASNAEITQKPGGGYSHGNWSAFDLGGVAGQDIYASRGGTVTKAGYSDLYGNFVEIFDEKLGKLIQYSHMLEPTQLKVGQTVNQGDIIGNVGDTGSSTGPHLDWAVRNAVKDEFGNIMVTGWGMPFDLGDVGKKLKDLLTEGSASVANFSNSVNESSIIIQDAAGNINKSATAMANKFIDLGATTAEDMADIIQLTNEGYIDWNGSISDITNDLSDFGYNIGLTGLELAAFINYMRDLQNNGVEETTVLPNLPNKPSRGASGMFGVRKPGEAIAMVMHEGGIVDEPDKNTFSSGLKANEVFAKLLKGEVVANEAQIRRFLNDTMPTLTRGAVEYSRINSPSAINISMPINVEGNLDKSVIPDLDKLANAVLDKATKTILSRGYVRSAGVVVS